jgi:hypothetical protein
VVDEVLSQLGKVLLTDKANSLVVSRSKKPMAFGSRKLPIKKKQKLAELTNT